VASSSRAAAVPFFREHPKLQSSSPLLRHDNLHLKMSSDADEEGLGLFQEPADFYEPEKQATFASHQLLSGQDLTVRLVGHNPLWVRVQ
jgi:hypothetical protein